MIDGNPFLHGLLANLRKVREKSGLSATELEDRLILGPGWVGRIERGEFVPGIPTLLAMLSEIGASLEDVLEGLPEPGAVQVQRAVSADQQGNDVRVKFFYGAHDAVYTLKNSKIEEFEAFQKVLRDGLAHLDAGKGNAEAVKRDSVVASFLDAAKKWPHANPSDIWWFLVYRAYCDPYNHPAKNARLDLQQSWKRTGGWALEEIVIRHYGPFLKKRGVNIFIADAGQKVSIVQDLKAADRIEADKIDVVLTGETPTGPRFFGVVHVKASFAERRTDDVHLSTLLKGAGYTTPLWTMDCKSAPSEFPVNRGELGPAVGKRSAKRKDIEDEGYFTRCFSYNTNTIPSLAELPADRRIYVCNFSNPDDDFSKFILQRWQAFYAA